MVGSTICVILGLISLICFMDKCAKHRSVQGVFIKNLTSIFFILTAFFGMLHSNNFKYGAFILIGLVFGMLGDIYLDQKWVYPKDEKKYLYAGFVSFGIGHIFYVIGIIRQTLSLTNGEGKWLFLIPIVIGAAVAVGNLILEKPMKQNFGEYKIVVTVYGFILAFMVGCALIAAILTKHTAFIVYTIGGVLFLVSDLILSPMYFGEGQNTPKNFILNHATYYAGQFMIAFTVGLVPLYIG